jgi:hypothetical protein
MAGQKDINDKMWDYPGVEVFDVDGEWVPSGDITQLYGEDEGNRIRKNSVSHWMYNVPGRGWVNQMQLAQEEGQRGNLSEQPTSKSIDDIIKASDVTQFLSSAMTDKTNTDTPYNLRPDISKYSSDDPLDLLFKMKDNERKRSMTPNEFLRILEEAQAQKPVIS